MPFCSINILIVTYRQHNLIGRAIDSILVQKEYGLKNIVICDDCSPDNNWDIINEYVDKYPTIIKAYRNEKNLGIYGNAWRLTTLRGDADLYYMMAGDDIICDGWFKEVQAFIEKNKVNLKDTAITFYSDYLTVLPDGRERLRCPVGIQKGLNPIILRLRDQLCNRSTLATREVFNRYEAVDLNRGISYAEEMFENQMQRYSEYNYYIPYKASVYYGEIGISTLSHTSWLQKVDKYQSIINLFHFKKKDLHYAKYKIQECLFFDEPSLKVWIQMVLEWIRSYDNRYEMNTKSQLSKFRSLLVRKVLNIKR